MKMRAVLLHALLCLRHLWSVAPIATSLVVPSTAGILSVFECPICQNLVEEPTVTACTHVFCCSCLDEWLQSFKARSSEPRCPSCQTGLGSRDSHAPLRLANPLAWRILSRVQLKCPLSSSGSMCSWVGDYSEVHSHLMKSDIHNADTLKRMPHQQGISKSKQYAEALKAQGNARFEARAFREASELYSKGLSAEPEDVTLLCNRAAAFLCDGKLNDCISDCRKAILIRANYVKAHQRLAQALCRRGSLAEAAAQLSRALSLVGAESGGQAGGQGDGLEELGEMHASCVHVIEALKAAEDKLESGDIKSARALVEAVEASETPGSFGTEKSPAVALMRARINVAAGVCHLAARQALLLLKDDEIELDVKSAALSVRGTALFFSGDTEEGLKHLKESLRLSPDVAATASLFKRLCKVKAATEAAKDAQLKRDFRSEIEHWTLVLSLAHAPVHSPFRADALSSRAGAHLQLREFAAVYADCSAAMDCLDDCRDARLVRGKALVAQGKTQEAENELAELLETHPHDEVILYWHRKAGFETKKRNRPDYYEILNVSSIASEREIKAAYRMQSLAHHPDRHSSSTQTQRAAAEEKFKMLQEALAILEDPLKRQLYDEGYCKEDIEERARAAERAAHRR